MPVSYLIDHRADGWHVGTRSGDGDVVFPTREAAISWIAQFGAGGVPARDRADEAPYLPAEDEASRAEVADESAAGEAADADSFLSPEKAVADQGFEDNETAGGDPRSDGES